MDFTIQYVPDEARHFGEKGAGIDVMCAEGKKFEVTTNRQTAPKLIAALKELVGQTLEVSGEMTQYGFKVSKDFRFPNDPRQSPGSYDGGGDKKKGDWETHDEREFKDASIVAQVAAKLAAQVAMGEGGVSADVVVAGIEEYTERIALTIRKAATRLLAEGSYPGARAEAPSATEVAAAVTPGGSGISDRLQEVIELGGGDTKAVIRAKRLASESFGTDDLGKLTDEQWFRFVKAFSAAEALVTSDA